MSNRNNDFDWRCLDKVSATDEMKKAALSAAKKTARPRRLGLAITAVAAAVALTVGVGAFLWNREPLPTQPENPTTSTTAVTPTTAKPTESEPTGTTATNPVKIPPEGMGGDISAASYYDPAKEGMPDRLINRMVADKKMTIEERDAYYARFIPEYVVTDMPEGKPTFALYSVYHFVREFTVPREYLEEMNDAYYETFSRWLYTEAEIDLIYGEDINAFIDHFANPCTVVVGTNMYTYKWLKANSTDVWSEKGITSAHLQTCIPTWEVMVDYGKNDDGKAMMEKVQSFCELTVVPTVHEVN